MIALLTIAIAGFVTGITTYLFGFGGGFVVVPFVYQMLSNDYNTPHEDVMHIAVATSTAVMIFNSTFATYTNYKKGLLDPKVIFPLIIYITIGSLFGALISYKIPDTLIRILFITYMVITILDCIFRKGFFNTQKNKVLSTSSKTFGGFLIGTIATVLGVGGSVMTIPLIKRHGNNMEKSVASANPLTLPIAVVGTFVYAFMSKTIHDSQYYYQGSVNLSILSILIFFGALGIFIARFLPKINDNMHAKIYIFLLICVTIAIAI